MARRLTVTFEGISATRLDKLAKGRQKSDVIREALALEEVYQGALAEGAKLLVRAPDGVEREIVRA